MNRRHFLSLTASSAAVYPLIGRASETSGPLAKHRITSLEVKQVPLPWPRLVGKNAKLDVHGWGPTVWAVVLKTDQGAVGWGEIPDLQKTPDELRSLTVGKTVAELINPASGILRPELWPIDIPLHDLAGVILDQPIWKMLGAEKPHLFPIYSGMIYFDELEPKDKPSGIDQVLKNCAQDRDLGYRQLKIKIGRGNRWMTPEAGLKRDIEVTQAIAKAFPDCALLVDANDGYSAATTIAFLKGIEAIPLFWLEEPFVETDAAWREVHAWTSTNGREKMLLADGEQHNDIPILEKLEADGILNVRLLDIISHGFTRWRELMPKLVKTRTLSSPHAWGSGLKTVYAAQLLAGLGNGASVEGVTCIHEHVDFGENTIRDGRMQVSSKPGFGLTLRES